MLGFDDQMQLHPTRCDHDSDTKHIHSSPLTTMESSINSIMMLQSTAVYHEYSSSSGTYIFILVLE